MQILPLFFNLGQFVTICKGLSRVLLLGKDQHKKTRVSIQTILSQQMGFLSVDGNWWKLLLNVSRESILDDWDKSIQSGMEEKTDSPMIA